MLVYGRIIWRQGGRYVSMPAGKSRVPIDIDPADRIPKTVKRKLARIEDSLTDQPLGIIVPASRPVTPGMAPPGRYALPDPGSRLPDRCTAVVHGRDPREPDQELG